MATTLSSTEQSILRGLQQEHPSAVGYQRLRGSSHQLLAFATAAHPLVARWPKALKPRSAWWQELSVQQLAAQHRIAPPILALNAQAQSTLMRKAELRQAELTSISELIRRCHQLPKVSTKLDIGHAFRYWFDLCKPNNRPWNAALNNSKAEHAAQRFAFFEGNWVQSHGDCVASNIMLLQQQTVFIDWEYHCLAPQWWDLAIYAESQHLSTDEESQLLEHYYYAVQPVAASQQLQVFRSIYADLAILWHCATMRLSNHYHTV
jgi:thiamine kinase-like enzyme